MLPAPSTNPHLEMNRLAGCLVALAVAYGVLVGHRWDYLAHFTLGAGLAVLAVLVAWSIGWPHDIAGVVALGMVLVGSIAAEFWFFSALLVDWADVGSGVLGAGVVAAVAVRARPGALGARIAGPLAAFLLVGGLLLRFGFDEPPGLP